MGTRDGRTWSRARIGLPNNPRIWTLVAAPDGRTAFAGTAVGVYRSTDDGETWQPAS